MKKELLSDYEQSRIFELAAANRHQELVQYFNSLLYARSLGSELCARPLGVRNAEELQEFCFALGYLDKLVDYTKENVKREMDKNVFLNYIEAYAEKLKTEIREFFKKEA